MEGYFIVKDDVVLAKYPPTFEHSLLKKWVEKEGGKYDEARRANGVDCGNGVVLRTYNPAPKSFAIGKFGKCEIGLAVVNGFVERTGTVKKAGLPRATKRARELVKSQLGGLEPKLVVDGVTLTMDQFEVFRKEALNFFEEDATGTFHYEFGEEVLSVTKQEFNKIDKTKIQSYRLIKKDVNALLKTLPDCTTTEQIEELYATIKARMEAP